MFPEVKAWLLCGKRVNLLDMEPQDIRLDEICTRLSRLCRYTGALPCFYSVAEHSLNLGRYFQCRDDDPANPPTAEDIWRSRRLRLSALLHDCTEAYIGDIIHPVKYKLCGQVVLDFERALFDRIVRALCDDPLSFDMSDYMSVSVRRCHALLTRAEIQCISKQDRATYCDIISGASQREVADTLYASLRYLGVREYGKEH